MLVIRFRRHVSFQDTHDYTRDLLQVMDVMYQVVC